MRRDRLDILKDILITCNFGKARKTEITYRSNLNFKKTTDYISWLVVHGFIKKDNEFYEITETGFSLLSNLYKIKNINVDSNKDC